MASGGLTILRNVQHSLPNAEQKLAAYILEHPHETAESTVKELGQSAGTSGATVIRLCKSLGMKGFQDLKMRIAGDLLKPKEQGYRDIDPGESLYRVVEKTTSNSVQSIRDTAEIMDYEQLQQAVRVLIAAPNVHFFGVGASSIVAMDAQQKLLRINKGATAFTDMHMAATLIANASKNDVFFAISHSGETKEIITLVKMAKKQGMKTIGLTHYGQSTVSDLCDICLNTSFSNEAPFRSAATSSRLAQLYLMDILFFGIATEQYDQTVDAIDNTRSVIQAMKKSYK